MCKVLLNIFFQIKFLGSFIGQKMTDYSVLCFFNSKALLNFPFILSHKQIKQLSIVIVLFKFNVYIKQEC